MGELVYLDIKRLERDFKNIKKLVDPCEKCNEKESCRNTCSRASVWWDTLVKLMQENRKNV